MNKSSQEKKHIDQAEGVSCKGVGAESTGHLPSDDGVVKRIKLGDIAGPNADGPLLVSDSELGRNMVVVGHHGSGKDACVENILWQQIRRGAGAMFIDGRHDGCTLEKIKRICNAAGRADDLLVINPDEPEMSHTYNPLLEGGVESVVSRIMSVCAGEGLDGSGRSMSVDRAGLTYVIGTFKSLGLAYTFEDLDKMMAGLWQCMERALARNLRDQKGIDSKKFEGDIDGLGARIGALAHGKIGEVMNVYDPQVNFFNAMTGNKIVYVRLPSFEKSATTSKRLAQFIISDLQSTIERMQRLPHEEKPTMPYLLLFNEFGAYATEQAALIWEQAVSAGVCACAAFQTFSSLAALDEGFANRIVGNSAIKMVYSLRDQDSSDDVLSLIGCDGKEVGVDSLRDLKVGEAVVSVVNDLYKIKGPSM